MKPPIIFSILHTSARPGKWKEIYDAWLGAAKHPELVEYVLVIDARWGFGYDTHTIDAIKSQMRDQDQVIQNTGRRCYVEGVNLAAAASCGQLLIVNADDQYPCQDWDTLLGSLPTTGIRTSPDEFVVAVTTGTPNEYERGLMVLPILSRARYRRYGYVFYPEYESMYADNDFYAQAISDGSVVDGSSLPVFPHRHPYFTENVPMDDPYRAQNDPSAYALGKSLFAAREASHFSGRTSSPCRTMGRGIGGRKLIACCLPGEQFSSVWVSNWTSLFGHMQNKHQVAVTFGYSSSVYCTRATMAHHLISAGMEFDYVLWLDDDNILTPEHLEMLIDDLERDPDLDVVVGWCWVQTDWYAIEGSVSCGVLSAEGMSRNYTHEELMEGQEPVKSIDWSGFPVVLMRGLGPLKAGGKHPFQALTEDQYSWGMAGEDVSFFVRAGRAGCKFAVDRRVEVPHFKSRAVGPEKNAFQGVQVVHKVEPK